MNYELAKKLKAAGWPQGAGYTDHMNCDGYGDPRKTCGHNDLDCPVNDKKYYIPSLHTKIHHSMELIVQELYKKGMIRFNKKSKRYETEEAVAQLWLKLQEK